MNVLADWKSGLAVDEYVNWYQKGDNSVKTSALNAMAESASEKVYKILSEAASENNYQKEEVIVKGTHIIVILNGEIIVDGDIADARDNGSMDHRNHPGLKRDKGHIGFLGHGSIVKFRNIKDKGS